MTFSPHGRLILVCDEHGRVLFWQIGGTEMGSLLGVYVAAYEVGAVHWQDTSHVILVDAGGPQGRPHFYRLELEGM